MIARWIVNLTSLLAQRCLLKSHQLLLGSTDIQLTHPIIRKCIHHSQRYTIICLNIVAVAILLVPRDSINSKDHRQLIRVLAITVKVMFHRILSRPRDRRLSLKLIILDSLYRSRPRDRLQVILCQVIIRRSILRLRRPPNT